jgi:hypothetical protein
VGAPAPDTGRKNDGITRGASKRTATWGSPAQWNGFLTYVPPLAGWGKPPAFPEYLFFGTIETVCTLVIIWQAWTWSKGEAAASLKRVVRQPEIGITSS